MATFHAGQRTHQAVLPQQLALEFAPADTPGSRDETGREDHTDGVVPGVEHGRGETGEGVTEPDRRHPGTSVPGEGLAARLSHPAVFVLDRHGRPLQPTSPARARKLLKAGRAVVARHTPFVIRLKDRTDAESVVSGVELGIDPGSKYTGLAVFAATGKGVRRGLYHVELQHRGGQIRDKLTARAAHRRGRRSRNLRYRTRRFRNRARPEGWLAPSLRHRVETTKTWATRLTRWAPVTAVHVELAAFDTQLLASGDTLVGAEYQHGTLAGAEVREYLLSKWQRRCAYCGASGVPLNIDHIHPRSRGGSDRISNLTLACIPCNHAKGSTAVEEFLKGKPALAARIQAQAKKPLRDAAAVNATRWALCRALNSTFPSVSVATGGRTKWNRQSVGLSKTHTLDALCVGVMSKVTVYPREVLTAVAGGRGRYRRTDLDRHGFPRKTNPRVKAVFGFQTGDYVRAVIPIGRYAGTHVGRVAVRTSGRFNMRTRHGLIQGIHHRHVRLLQRADGYAYATRDEAAVR
ncbi:5-methylcytosine-specific restriction endonuclease McrA [Streptomyces canus]|uniref:RNA-guided endonuclease IscB n=1 Tax=Streptomyces canus TaxID=58343 RepID=UPI002785BC46|nr:RNA-guided endonuclease IscB [Streptomyces canus]MDQ0599578.1 5-methylcytosine-specific restriction endonuclease McrA [Streptomyces canus]